MALARLSVLKTLMGVSLTNTTFDSLLKNYLSASTVAFEKACNRKIEKVISVEPITIENPDDCKIVYLKNTPILSIFKVSTSSAVLLSSAYSKLGDNKMYVTNGLPLGRYSTVVSYTAGYDTAHWMSIGLANTTATTYTGMTSINNGTILLVHSFPSSVSIAKHSIATGDPKLTIWEWTTSKTVSVAWSIPLDIEQVIAEDTAIQILKIKPSDATLSTLGESRIGVVKFNRGVGKGGIDSAEFEKYIDGFSARWKQCVRANRSYWYK
jgi:hypothetical protein